MSDILHDLLTPCVVYLILSAAACAQAPGGAPPRVALDITVTDGKGRFLLDLPRTAFHIYEGKAEQQIEIFRREDPPASIGILLDNSGSMRARRPHVEAAALAFIKARGRDDEFFIANFNESIWFSGFTNDLSRLENGMRGPDAYGPTALHDAVLRSIEMTAKNARMRKRLLVIFTDGDENASGTMFGKLRRSALEAGVPIFTIHLLRDDQRSLSIRFAQSSVREIAAETGGAYFQARTAERLQEIAVGLAQEIRNQYLIEYSPRNPPPSGEFRGIRVKVDTHGRTTVRARRGYYWQP